MTKPRASNHIDVHVGNRLLVRRTQLGMSQEALGNDVGVTFQQVQKYEKGSNRIGASRLWRLCEILDVEPNYFFEGLRKGEQTGGTPASEEATAIADFMSSSQGAKLAIALADIDDPDFKAQVLKLIQSVADGKRGSS